MKNTMPSFIIAINTALNPILKSFFTLNSMPTKNRSSIAPISMAMLMTSLFWINPKALGPTMAPAIKTPKTEGCLNLVANTPPSTENSSTNSKSRLKAMAKRSQSQYINVTFLYTNLHIWILRIWARIGGKGYITYEAVPQFNNQSSPKEKNYFLAA